MKYTLCRGNDPKKVAFALKEGEKIHQIEAKKAFDVLRAVSSKGELMLGSKKLLYDPFVVFQVMIVVKGNTLHPFFCYKDQKIPFHVCPLILHDAHPFFVYEGLIRSFEGGFPKMEQMFHKILELNQKQMSDFLENYHEDPPEWGPNVVIEEPVIVEVNPVGQSQAKMTILLKDDTGAFIDVAIDGADKQLEKSFLQDITDAGYVYKPMNNSSYYCPTHDVKGALSLLSGMGYDVLGPNNEPVLFSCNLENKSIISQNRVQLSGSIRTTQSTFSLKDMVQTYAKGKMLLKGEKESLFLDLEELEQLTKIPYQVDEDRICLQRYYAPYLLDRLKGGVDGLIPYQELQAPQSFNGDLFVFQQQGLSWLYFHYLNGFSALLADEMGLGKTVQTIAFLSKILDQKKALIVAPLTLLHQWKAEIQRFSKNLSVEIVDKQLDVSSDGVYLISYQMLRSQIACIQKQQFEVLILDEAHEVKNSKTKGYAAVAKVDAKFKIALSGTPIENRLADLINLFALLLPDLLVGVDLNDVDQIKTLIKPFILRRSKKEVLQQMPEKITQVVYLDLYEEQQQAYDARQKECVALLKEKKQHVFSSLLQLRQHVLSPKLLDQDLPSAKLDQVLADIYAMAENGQKVLVFSYFPSLLKMLVQAFQELNIDYFYIDGQTKNRDIQVNNFKEHSSGCAFLISLKAGGLGLNLVEADTVILFEPWWNPQVEAQAIDRAHRLGRKDSLLAKRYIAFNTIEEHMERIKEQKTALANHIIEDSDISEEILNELFKDLI
jgi:superfamily II DNA or RNA helicase